MMKIQIASDLHLEFLDQRFPDYRVIEHTDADVLVIAGDIHRNTKAFNAFADWPVPVIYVHGNHEAYKEKYFDLVEKMENFTECSNVHYLERKEYISHDVRFLGCCLWTDYRVDPSNPMTAMREAERELNDHKVIRGRQGRFTAQDALKIHQKSRLWLEEKLDEDFDGRTVVVTHHGPHPNSIHPRFEGTLLNAAFVSDLTPLIEKADVWIHGHVHDSFDYEVGGTRVIANPRGYPSNYRSARHVDQLEWENEAFNPALVIEI